MRLRRELQRGVHKGRPLHRRRHPAATQVGRTLDSSINIPWIGLKTTKLGFTNTKGTSMLSKYRVRLVGSLFWIDLDFGCYDDCSILLRQMVFWLILVGSMVEQPTQVTLYMYIQLFSTRFFHE